MFACARSAPRVVFTLPSLLLGLLGLLSACGGGANVAPPPTDPGPQPAGMGDAPTVAEHLDQGDVAAGTVPMDEVLDHGRHLFVTFFNSLDGAGRPESTGTGAPRPRREFPENVNRISAPDANSCAGCHNLPRAGGGGDDVANVFVMAQRLPFVNFDGGAGDGNQDHTLRSVGNERNTLGMFGSGYVELLAREITASLHAQRAAAIEAASQAQQDVTVPLVAKGISFGQLTARPDGTVDTAAVEGIDVDLVVKPFHQKGVVISLREFTNNAMNHHHGMQTAERFGAGADPDADGHADELTDGDVTAVTLFQATLAAPGRVLPPDDAGRAAVARGETAFQAMGCATCHVPALRLDSALFTEPSPYNPAGNLRPGDGPSVTVDLSTVGEGPRLPAEADGSVLVPLFSDLKRHDMGPALANEVLVQNGVPVRFWLTKKLWGFANEPPFLHHGRATLISDAILLHGGEAQASRDAFAALSPSEQADIVEFLKTLRTLPPDAPSLEATAPAAGPIGDAPAFAEHTDQAEVDSGALSLDVILARGKALFDVSFNALDGVCRPETTGTGAPRTRFEGFESFNRISGPDANACVGCHNIPRSGGGGDMVADVFVLAQRFPFLNFDGGAGDEFQDLTLEQVGNRRGTVGMFGAGWIELLAREMTADLHAIRDEARAAAVSSGADETRGLVTKGVSFGSLTARPDGLLDTSLVEGVNADLIVRPFHQKGAVISLRQFSNNALNHHHGIQSTERFGLAADHDADGHLDECSWGDVTAITLFQATLPVPGRVFPADPARRAVVDRGEELFGTIGCAECHRPTLRVNDPVFREPGPYNPPGNLGPADVSSPYEVDLTAQGPTPRLGRQSDGSVLVPAFTDLKRHDMGPLLDDEKVIQDGIPTRMWLTKKLWGFSSEPPFLHNGAATLVGDAILAHGGEGQAARDAFAALTADDQDAVIAFLKTLQILPEDATATVVVR